MTAGAAALSEAFARLRVLVIGDAMLDAYLSGRAARISPEAPVPVVDVASEAHGPGGAANVAANVSRLGAKATLLSAVGDDSDGERLLAVLADRDVDANVVVDPARRTLTKTRVAADGQVLVRFDRGSGDPAGPASEREIADRLAAGAAGADAVVVADYGYGVITDGVLDRLAAMQRRDPRLLVLDAKDLTRYRHAGATVAKPNYRQVIRLLGLAALPPGDDRVDQMLSHREELLEAYGTPVVAVTLDVDGAVFLERGKPGYRTYARRHTRPHPAGAGDTFAAALTLALAAGSDTPQAAEVAAAAAAVVVGKEGTATCAAWELRDALASPGKEVEGPAALTARLAAHREVGRRIVFTNGCFDILHRGHVTYLNRAKSLGDVLVVGVNTDQSVRRLKGDGRPINTLEDRVAVLAGLSSVDHIVPFHEETPVELIRLVRPDVFVKGGDYTREMLPEAPVVEALGGEVHILPYVEDRSTSGLIERIRTGDERPDRVTEPA